MVKIKNIHQREIAAPDKEVGALIDTVSCEHDQIWPHERWPRMRLHKPLGVGAKGGHGPIQYEVVAYTPGRHVRFEFKKHLDGYHEIVLDALDDHHCLIKHTIDAKAQGINLLKWWMIIRPLHDALIEDLFDKVERNLGHHPQPRSWGIWAKWLHGFLRKQKKL